MKAGMAASLHTVVLITALDVEYSSVRLFLRDVRTLTHPSGTVYEVGAFESESTAWNVILVETGIGNPIAAIETARALDYFNPHLALFVGIAGGVKDVEVGDVVAADYVYGYQSSKAAAIFESRIKTFGSGYPLVQRARAVRRTDEWHKRLSRAEKPRAFVGPVASGEQILASREAPTHELIKSYCGDALVVETEGWGFMFGAHTSGDVPAMVVRGVSDTLSDKDPTTDLVNQPIAAHSAAAFAFELLATVDPAAIRMRVWHENQGGLQLLSTNWPRGSAET